MTLDLDKKRQLLLSIKSFGNQNYFLDSTEIITCYLLSHGGIYIDNIEEMKNNKALVDLQNAGFVFGTKYMNRVYVYPDHFVDINNMVK